MVKSPGATRRIRRCFLMSADTMSDSSLPIDELVERLRTIKRSSPELYQEAWGKLPRKTQSAILSYEEHHKSTHAHTSHTTFEDHEPLTPHHASTPRPHEDHQRPSHPHTSHTDYEAPERLSPLHAPTSRAASEPDQPRPGRHKTTSRISEREETEKQLKQSVASGIPKAHQIIKRAADNTHLPNTLEEVLLATQVYQLELIRISLNKLTETLAKQ